jgi:hypothetical protein
MEEELIKNFNQASAKMYAWIDNDTEKLIQDVKSGVLDSDLLYERMKALHNIMEILEDGQKGLKALYDKVFEVALEFSREKRQSEANNFDWLAWHEEERKKYGSKKWNLENYQSS